MENFSKLLEITQTLIKIFKENKIFKILAYSFMSFSFVFLLEQILSLYIIITPMFTAIRDVSILGMIISAGVMASYVFVNAIEKASLKIKNKILSERERKTLMEAERKKAEAVREILDGLSGKEKAIMKYVLAHDGAAWLPCENIYVMKLLWEGHLKSAHGVSILRGIDSFICAQCFGCTFSSDIKKYVSEHKEELSKSWEEIPEIKDFDAYQED